jgi:GT2 family glycosyltransferase
MSRRGEFNPELFAFDPAQAYAWRVFDRFTVGTITFNRLEHTRKFFDGLLRHTHTPIEIIVVDNASTDGTVEYLRDLAARTERFRLVENSRNVGKGRALLQIRDMLADGLAVLFDNDIEILSNYWDVHLLKAFHAARLRLGSAEVAFGLRLLNCEEYGFRFAGRREVLPIPAARNALPRSSYAATSKDSTERDRLLDEEVVVGWTEFLLGGCTALPVAVFKRVRLEELYPMRLGGEDPFMSAELRRMGIPFGYIENGPVARHNDWPYTEAKVALYERLTRERAVTDLPYLRRALRDRWRRLAARLDAAKRGSAQSGSARTPKT